MSEPVVLTIAEKWDAPGGEGEGREGCGDDDCGMCACETGRETASHARWRASEGVGAMRAHAGSTGQ